MLRVHIESPITCRNFSTPPGSSAHSLRTKDFFTELDLEKENVPEGLEQSEDCASLT